MRNVGGAGARPGLRGCRGGRLIWGGRLGLWGQPLWTAWEGYAPLALPIGMRITMANPFEDPDAPYRVLVNHEGG